MRHNMKKTIIINLYGGPGVGKSTLSSGLFHEMKKQGYSVELVTEFVKEWAWENKNITSFDQPYIFGQQSQREARLYGKVDYIITDSPLLLNDIYDQDKITGNIVTKFQEFTKSQGIYSVHFVLPRTKEHKPEGRYQTEEEAKKLDKKIENMLLYRNIPFKKLPNENQISNIIFNLGLYEI